MKEAKREAKNVAFQRTKAEAAKVRESLIIQDILARLANNEVRDDFLNGSNGACQIEAGDMKLLEKLYLDTKPKRPTRSNQPTFTQSAKVAADHFSSVIDGRSKAFGEKNYAHIKSVLEKIKKSGYFEKDIVQVDENAEDVEEESNQDVAEKTDANDVENEIEMKTDSLKDAVSETGSVNGSNSSAAPTPVQVATPAMAANAQSRVFVEAPAATAVPPPSFPPQPPVLRPIVAPQPIIAPILVNPAVPAAAVIVPPAVVPVVAQPALAQPQPPVVAATAAQLGGPTTVQAVEHAYFKQHQYQIQQQMRPPPIHEVIGTGNFFFLQESEIDTPDVLPTMSFQSNVQPAMNLSPNPNPIQPSMSPASQPLPQQPPQQQQQQQQQQQPLSPSQIQQMQMQPQKLPPHLQGPPVSVNPQATSVPSPTNITSQTFTNQNYQNIVPSMQFNQSQHQPQPQPPQHQQQHQPLQQQMHMPPQQHQPQPHQQKQSILKANDMAHIPGFASSSAIVSTSAPITPPMSMQPPSRPDSKGTPPMQQQQQQKPPGPANSILGANFPQSVQQFMQSPIGMSQPQNKPQSPQVVKPNYPGTTISPQVAANLNNMLVDSATEKLKSTLNITDSPKTQPQQPSAPPQSALPPVQQSTQPPPQQQQPSQQPEWNTAKTDYSHNNDQWNSPSATPGLQQNDDSGNQYNRRHDPYRSARPPMGSSSVNNQSSNQNQSVAPNMNSGNRPPSGGNKYIPSGNAAPPAGNGMGPGNPNSAYRNSRPTTAPQPYQQNGSNGESEFGIL